MHVEARQHDACASGRGRQRGFTLVELMVTLAVLVVLMAVAVPSFRSITLSNRLTTNANELVGAIQTARMEAIKRNARTQFCSNSDTSNTTDTLGDACDASAGAVVALSGANAVVVRESNLSLTGDLQLHGNVTALRFSAQGIAHATSSSAPYTGTVADICTPSLSGDNHRVIRMAAGSVLQTDTETSTGCSP
ncbi:GspH/FimT family pseudopilin [Dyella kyungheensis]|uniref:Type II secretion system protein H n=1 Tax=Dyella kyungheensis TaxID=1242174 RepID=A0ABS2JL38_9GAMM|nr:GspH/FimT family pseudopilin [Dyella kyungheensis]MBM7119752.1 GspH/FimT family pseudopilin [Dyella kyungheensis]